MNKLIQKLAYESARTVDANLMAQDPAFVEKFAMMIIQECANIYEAIDNGNTVHGAEDFQQALRRHFK